MGFYSWLCAKSKKSIPAFPHAGRPIWHSEVVQVLPDNSKVEGIYDGYGNIGGVDIHDSIAPFYFKRKDATRDDIFSKKKYIVAPDGNKFEIVQLRYDEPIKELGGLNMNDAETAGYKIDTDFDRCQHLIKIVRKDFYKGETFDQLDPSPHCPDQGFFYDDEEEVSVHDQDVEE